MLDLRLRLLISTSIGQNLSFLDHDGSQIIIFHKILYYFFTLSQMDYIIPLSIAIVVVGVMVCWWRKSSKVISPPAKQESQSTIAKTSGTEEMEKDPKPSSMLSEAKIQTVSELEKAYPQLFFGYINLKPSQSMHNVTAIAFKHSKIVTATTKNQMIMYNLKTWKRDGHKPPEKYFTNLGNSSASALAIGQRYYYVALTFDRTIVYYDFKGGENGVYFKEVCRFPRGVLKSNAQSLYVPENENYIISCGSESDTTIDIWSLKGQKLNSLNSYQIQHYEIMFGQQNLLVRGWTSEVKVYNFCEEKDNSFKKIEKSVHLAHQEHPLSASIDHLDMYALTITQGGEVKLWPLHWGYSSGTVSMHANPIVVECQKLGISKILKCGIHTVTTDSGRFKTLLIFYDQDNRIVITDREWQIHQTIEGIECKELYLVGTKSAVLGIFTTSGKMLLWNLTNTLQHVPEYQV